MPDPPTVVLALGSADARRQAVRALARDGCEVVPAVDGGEVLRFSAGAAPALVVAEASLPALDVDELGRRLTGAGTAAPWVVLLVPAGTSPPARRPGFFVAASDLPPARLVAIVRLAMFARATGCQPNDYLDAVYGDLDRLPIGELLQAVARHRLTGRLILSVEDGAGLCFTDGAVVDGWWGAARGRKAFNRVATRTGDRFVIRLDEPGGGHTISGDIETLVNDALDESYQLERVLGRLPALTARVNVGPVAGIAAADLDPVESEVLSRALRATTLSELMEWVTASDADTARAVERLCRRGLLTLKEG